MATRHNGWYGRSRHELSGTARAGLVTLILAGLPVDRLCAQNAAPACAWKMDAGTVTVPFDYRNHQILVHAREADGHELTLMLDTGASAIVVDSAVHVAGSPLKTSKLQEADGDVAAAGVLLDSLALQGVEGRVMVTGARAYRIDLAHMSRALGQRLDGILGVTFLAGFVTEIDYQAHTIRFLEPHALSPSAQGPDNRNTFEFALTPANLLSATPSLLLAGRLADNFDYSFLLDTGFGGSVGVPRRAAEASGLLREDTPRHSSVSYSLTRQFKTEKIRASYLKLGALDLRGRTITVESRNGDAVGQPATVGNRLLQSFRVTLDYPRRRLRMERVSDQQEPDEDDKPALGLAVRRSGDVIRVDRVERNSPARRSGVRPGDTVLAVNGQPAGGPHAEGALAILAAPTGDITLALARAVDPNFGTTPGRVTLTITPSSPLDWKAP